MASQHEGAPGERVIPGSKRPDGTMRKEIRIRAGYIPQDEVEKYVARGTRPKSDGNDLPPGMDPESAAAQKAAKKKSAKKNANRKEKKATAASEAATEDTAVARISGLSIDDKVSRALKEASQGASQAQNGGAQTGQGEEQQSLEKQLRNIRKKIRQAESLEAAVAARAGAATPEEQEKIDRLSVWREEAEQLERQISS